MGAESRYGKTPSGVINPIEWEEHAEVGGVAGKKVFPVNLPPTGQTNPSEVITETVVSNVLTTVIVKTISGTNYTKTIVEDFNTGITTESAWT